MADSAAQDHDFEGRGPTCLRCGYDRTRHKWPYSRFDRWYFSRSFHQEEAPDGR